MNKLRLLIKNPLIWTVPMIVMLLLAWQHYSLAASPINTSLSNSMTNGGFDALDANGFPSGWTFSKGNDSASTRVLDGYRSAHLLELKSDIDSSVNSTLASPGVDIAPGHTYFYKGFYTSSMPFDLLVKSTKNDGSTTVTTARHYPPNGSWSTVSDVFTADSTAKSVQMLYSFSEKGTLQLDGNYLEQDPQDVYSEPVSVGGVNLIPNPSFESTDGTLPDAWSAIGNGDNNATFTYITTGTDRYLHTDVANYKNGEAKWRYEPIATSAHHNYSFDVSYRSSVPVDIVAEYAKASGERSYITLDTLQPAKDWTTTLPVQSESPPDATSIFITLVQHGNGFTDTKNYQMQDTTKTGDLAWDRPYVSLTFDDGWASTYDNALPLLAKDDYKATFYLDPSSIDTPGFMSSDQVLALKKVGHEPASHGYEHLDFTTLTAPDISYQMERAYQYFAQVHGENAVDFAAPYGNSDPQLAYYVRKYYRSLRGTEDGINTRQNFDPYNLKTLYVGRETPVAKITSALADTKAANGWLILIYHKIGPDDTTSNTTLGTDQFAKQLAAIKNSNIAVEPISAVMDDLVNK